MADMAAEAAFLEAQRQEYDPASTFAAAAQPASADDEEEYDPDIAFSTDQAQRAHTPSEKSASMPESASNTPPAATEAALKPQPADAAAASTPSKQPRTKGGFVDDSEDDEEDVPVAKPISAGSALLNASGVSESPQRSSTLTPSNLLAQQDDVPSHSAQAQGAHQVPSPSVAAHASASTVAAAVPNGGSPAPDATKKGASDQLKVASARQSAAPPTPVSASLPKPRLAQDRIGILEDRIAEDPRGDVEAWLSLIEEYRKRHKHEEARAVYERFFKVFPAAGEQWVEYVNMESELDNFGPVETIFGKSIMQCPHITLWSSYIDYVRRRQNLNTDPTGQARQVIIQVYEFVLDNIGIDVNAGKIWVDYIELLKSGPGILGGNNWQDMQKMDTVRKAYQRAIAVPTNATLELWREYDRFEMNLNKATGRKYLQDRAPFYMTARSAVNLLDKYTKAVHRTTLPKLPPAPGFDGYEEYMGQVKAWKDWIEWEKSDPLEIKLDDKALYNKRVLYLYKNALMALRFWPEMWYEAAEWCYQNEMQKEGDELLNNGMEANPESCLLAFKKAHQMELTTGYEDGEVGIIKKGQAVREPFDKVLNALYELTNKAKKREEQTIARAKEAFAAQQAAEEAARANSDRGSDDDDDDEDSAAAKRQKEKQEALDSQLQGISKAANAEIHTLKKTLSYAWIALMQAMRRVQGKGAPNGAVPGFRGVFAEARKKGKLLSDLYVASALIEHHCYQDPAASRIFERGMKLFPDDEHFALEYIKHLIQLNDSTNARAVFETIVSRLTQKPENVYRVKPLFEYFHQYESQFGDLTQIAKLEQRMATLFPEDSPLRRFTARFSSISGSQAFDPTQVRPIISPRTQMRPAMPAGVVPTVEPPLPPQIQMPQEQRVASPALLNSPRLGHLIPSTNSPKRPLEDDGEFNQPRKLARGESPLKGAAGRRLDAARRSQVAGNTPIAAGPAPLPRGINFLLGIIPGAKHYDTTRFSPEGMVALLRSLTLPLPENLQSSAQSVSAPPPSNIGAQLQNIQARYGGGGWS